MLQTNSVLRNAKSSTGLHCLLLVRYNNVDCKIMYFVKPFVRQLNQPQQRRRQQFTNLNGNNDSYFALFFLSFNFCIPLWSYNRVKMTCFAVVWTM